MTFREFKTLCAWFWYAKAGKKARKESAKIKFECPQRSTPLWTPEMVRVTGLEPARFWQWNLNPPSLPIPPHPHMNSRRMPSADIYLDFRKLLAGDQGKRKKPSLRWHHLNHTCLPIPPRPHILLYLWFLHGEASEVEYFAWPTVYKNRRTWF